VTDGVLVVLPTFNEVENLERVVDGVRQLGHDVLIVDDASPDGTGGLADRLATAVGSRLRPPAAVAQLWLVRCYELFPPSALYH